MRSFVYFCACLAGILTLFISAPANYLTLIALGVLLFTFFLCVKSYLVDQKNLKNLCHFYEQAHIIDDLFLLINERPYKKILDAVVDLGRFDWAVLFLMDFDNDKFVAVESSGIMLSGFKSVRFDDISAAENLDSMTLSVKLLDYAFKAHGFKGALAGSAIEKNSVFYGCMLVGRDDPEARLSEVDGLRLNILSDQVSICLHNYRLHNELSFRAEQLSEQQEQLNKELTMAKNIQDTAITISPPSFAGIEISCFVKPARFVGGDFLKFFPNPTLGKMSVLIGDVCGKGVPAALVMAVALSLFQEKKDEQDEPAQLMSEVNLALKKFLGNESKFNSTAVFGTIDLQQKKILYASAGHDYPLLVKGSTNKIVELESTGTLLGIFADSKFFSRSVELDSGDFLVFYSDGLVDLFEGIYKIPDGYPELQKLLLSRKDSSPEEIVNEIKRMVEADKVKQKDDITLAVVKIK
jgi:serine phosphatase RsbU (regulator of sigma subunit)